MVVAFQFILPTLESRFGLTMLSVAGTFFIGFGLWSLVFHITFMPVVSVILWSIGEILVFGIIPVYIKVFSRGQPEKEEKFSSMYYSTYYLSRCIGPVIGSAIYQSVSVKSLYLDCIFILAIASGVVFFILASRTSKLGENYERAHE